MAYVQSVGTNQHLGKILSLILVLMLVTGCAAVRSANPVASAETTEQRAYALYGTFVVFEERAVPIVRNRAVHLSVRRAIQKADRIAKPLADELYRFTIDLSRARRAVAKGGQPSEVIPPLISQVERSIIRLKPALKALQSAVEKVSE